MSIMDLPTEDVLQDMMNSLIDEIEIIPDDDLSTDHFEGPDGAPLSPNKVFGFGFDIEANEDGSLKYPEVILTKDMIRPGLSHVTRTLDTFEFAYSRFEGKNKNLTNIDALEDYVHLRTVDLSGNRLSNFKVLTPMKHLLVLCISDNLLASFEDIPELPFLQALNAKGNLLTSVDGLFKNSLAYVQLNMNNIEQLDNFNAETFPWLTVLELRGNKLSTLEGLNIPTLLRLFVAGNELTSFEGLQHCVHLTHLHARENKLSKLENFPKLEKLEYVNLRQNEFKRFTQTAHLGNSPNIRILILKGNPIDTLGNYKLEMTAVHLNLKRLDKEPIAEMDLVEGRQLRNGREKGIAAPLEDDPGMTTPPPEPEPEPTADEVTEDPPAEDAAGDATDVPATEGDRKFSEFGGDRKFSEFGRDKKFSVAAEELPADEATG